MGDQEPLGTTEHFRVLVDPALKDKHGYALSILETCENDFAVIQNYFGGIKPPILPIDVWSIDDEGAGWSPRAGPRVMWAGTRGRDGVSLYWYASFLTAVELVEFFAIGQVGEFNGLLGWSPARSPGEGLSRVIGDSLYPGASFHTPVAISWWNHGNPDQQKDFVNHNGSDVDDTAVGCSVLFLNYLRYVLNIGWGTIVQLAGAELNFRLTLRDVCSAVTDDDADPYPQFQSYVNDNYGWYFQQAPGTFGDNPFWHETGDPTDVGG